MPDVGERVLLDALVARRIKISQERLRNTIHRVDPITLPFDGRVLW